MMKKDSQKIKNTEKPWPRLTRLSPKTLLLAVFLWLLFAWLAFLAVDIFELVDLGIRRPLWVFLFNDRPIEWTQWFVFVFAIVTASYLSGRLDAENKKKAARFFLLFAIGLGLMLIEDAGDIRHVLSADMKRLTGPMVWGVSQRVISDVPYFALLAVVPLYAVFRYGRYVWQSVRSRAYLVFGIILYAIAAIGSGLRYLGNFYIIVGGWFDRALLGGRFPIGDREQKWAHFALVDSLLEETVELLALAMLFAAILAFSEDFRRNRLQNRKLSKEK